jgi:hypothetical protein
LSNDPRCCGTGTCLINADGECWCGQRWDGEKMCHAPLQALKSASPATSPVADGLDSTADRGADPPGPG